MPVAARIKTTDDAQLELFSFNALEQLLTPEDLDSARATMLNAHYTAPVVVRAMYAALQRLGFAHGRILEPALGLGHFIRHIHDYFFAAALDKVRTRHRHGTGRQCSTPLPSSSLASAEYSALNFVPSAK